MNHSYPMQLDINNKDVAVWLVKLPPFLCRELSDMDSDTDIGYINVVATKEGRVCSISLSINGIDVQYTIRFNDTYQHAYVLNGDRIDGRITKEVFVTPVFDQHYLAYKRGIAHVRSSTRIVESMRRAERYGRISELESMARKRKRELQMRKRERLERGEAMDMVFKAFEKHEAWTAKDLADFSGQPIAYIQEILNEIGVLNKKDYRCSYVLKPEYKDTSDSAD